MSEGIAQGPYKAAKVEFEPVTLRTQGTELTTEPPRHYMSLQITIKLSINAQTLEHKSFPESYLLTLAA